MHDLCTLLLPANLELCKDCARMLGSCKGLNLVKRMRSEGSS